MAAQGGPDRISLRLRYGCRNSPKSVEFGDACDSFRHPLLTQLPQHFGLGTRPGYRSAEGIFRNSVSAFSLAAASIMLGVGRVRAVPHHYRSIYHSFILYRPVRDSARSLAPRQSLVAR